MSQVTEATSGVLEHRVKVTLTDNAVVIKRGMIGSSERTIPLKNISEVIYKTRWKGDGYIEFVAPGVDGRIPFSIYKKAEFAALKAAVDEAMAQ